MTTLTPSPRTAAPQPEEASRLTRWSLWMLPTFALVYFATSFIGLYLIFPLLGLKEGDILLFDRSVAGWAWAIGLWLLLVAAPVAGVVLAVKALRRGGRSVAWTGFALNGVLVLLSAYMIFDEIRMTYFPDITFPFGS
jgi:hypothetical protein